MRDAEETAHDRLIRQLETISELKREDKDALRRLPLQIRSFGAREELVREGDRPSQCCLLIDGLLSRYKILDDGVRQVLAYHIPGEIPDLQSLFLHTMDHTLGAVVASRVAFIPHSALRGLLKEHPDLAAAFWRETLIDGAIFREWVVNLGARPARSRVAHLFCELFGRLKSVGLAGESGFTLPLTQVEIADATGLSAVHVNRSIQELRAEGLIASEGKFLRILNWPGLQKVGGFERRYLHLRRQSDEP